MRKLRLTSAVNSAKVTVVQEVAPVWCCPSSCTFHLSPASHRARLGGDTVGKPSMKVLRATTLRVKEPCLHKTITTHGRENAPLTLISNPDNGRGEGRRGVSS